MRAIGFIMNWTIWLLLVIPVGAGTMITYQAVRKSLSSDQAVINDCNTKIKNTIKGAIIGITLSGLIAAIKKFYT